MGRKKSAHGYELELRRMIKSRTGADCEVWLYPQVRATAANMVLLDKMQEELAGEDSLVSSLTGCSGQQKVPVNQLVAAYDKAQRTLMKQLESLGLNYNATPSKVKEDTRKGVDESDPLVQFYRQVND